MATSQAIPKQQYSFLFALTYRVSRLRPCCLLVVRNAWTSFWIRSLLGVLIIVVFQKGTLESVGDLAEVIASVIIKTTSRASASVLVDQNWIAAIESEPCLNCSRQNRMRSIVVAISIGAGPNLQVQTILAGDFTGHSQAAKLPPLRDPAVLGQRVLALPVFLGSQCRD